MTDYGIVSSREINIPSAPIGSNAGTNTESLIVPLHELGSPIIALCRKARIRDARRSSLDLKHADCIRGVPQHADTTMAHEASATIYPQHLSTTWLASDNEISGCLPLTDHDIVSSREINIPGAPIGSDAGTNTEPILPPLHELGGPIIGLCRKARSRSSRSSRLHLEHAGSIRGICEHTDTTVADETNTTIYPQSFRTKRGWFPSDCRRRPQLDCLAGSCTNKDEGSRERQAHEIPLA